MRGDRYILQHGYADLYPVAVGVDDDEARKWTDAQRLTPKQGLLRVGQTELPNGDLVSTIFLGHDSAWESEEGRQHGVEHKPLLFETRLFRGGGAWPSDNVTSYSTWGEAIAGHRGIVKFRRSLPDNAFIRLVAWIKAHW